MHSGENGDDRDSKVAGFLRLKVVMRKQVGSASSIEYLGPLLLEIKGAIPLRELGRVRPLHISGGSYLILQAAVRGLSKVSPRNWCSARKSAETLTHFTPVIKATLLVKDRAFGSSLLLISCALWLAPRAYTSCLLKF